MNLDSFAWLRIAHAAAIAIENDNKRRNRPKGGAPTKETAEPTNRRNAEGII